MAEVIKPALGFLRNVRPKDKVAIIFGHDADTVCSAAIMYKLLKKRGAKPVLVGSEENFTITKKTIAAVKKLKPSHIILVDIGDVSMQLMDELAKIGYVLNIDHHMPKAYTGIVYVNPRLSDKHAYIPATYLCYKIYEKFFNADEIQWIAGIGNLGDHAVTNCRDLFEKIKSDMPELIGDAELVDEALFDNSVLGKLTKMIDSARVVVGSKGSMKAVQVLLGAKKYSNVLENVQLKRWNKVSEAEFKRILADFWKTKRAMNGVVFYQIRSKYNFKSALAGYLQQFFEDKILAIGQKEGRMLDISLRRGTSVDTDLAELAIRIVADIPGSRGGGHEAASAVRMPAGKVSKLLEILNE